MDVVNTAVLTVFNLAVVALLVWFIGSIALRFVGWGWMLFGVAIAVHGAATGTATAGTYGLVLFNLALGSLFWSCGHALYRVRHGYWKSSLLGGLASRLRRRPPMTQPGTADSPMT